MTSRYAVYWVPARDDPLWSLGCAWLGRDAETGELLPPLREHAEAPRRYGFHATLTAPTVLKDGVGVDDWLAAVRGIAAETPPFAMPPLAVRPLGRFVALRPLVEPDAAHPLRRLADRCVVELEALRAPLPAAEFERRACGLDVAGLARQQRYGYAHVLDGWRFHLTLSDDFGDDADAVRRRAALLDEARAHFAPMLERPLASREIAVFVEAVAGEPFLVERRLALGG